MTGAQLLGILGPLAKLLGLLAELYGERDARKILELHVRKLEAMKRTEAWAVEKHRARRAKAKRKGGR
jgi:hypothetical protein